MDNSINILVLNYHQLSDDVSESSFSDPLYSIHSLDFEKQMQFLFKEKIPVFSLDALVKNQIKEKFGVILTFDDGYSSDYQLALPILKELNFTASFFPFINSIGTRDRLSWEQLRTISENGFTIGSHGISHTVFRDLNRQQQQNEMFESKNILQNNLGIAIDHFSSPYGYYTKDIIHLAKSTGYQSILTTGLRMNHPEKKPYLIHRWNLKRNTTQEKFEKIILNKKKFPLKEVFSENIKSLTKKSLGPALSNRLNVLINKSRKK